MPTPHRRRERRDGNLSAALGRADLAAESAFARRWGLSFRHGAG